jgi:hypothetical protein
MHRKLQTCKKSCMPPHWIAAANELENVINNTNTLLLLTLPTQDYESVSHTVKMYRGALVVLDAAIRAFIHSSPVLNEQTAELLKHGQVYIELLTERLCSVAPETTRLLIKKCYDLDV